MAIPSRFAETCALLRVILMFPYVTTILLVFLPNATTTAIVVEVAAHILWFALVILFTIAFPLEVPVGHAVGVGVTLGKARAVVTAVLLAVTAPATPAPGKTAVLVRAIAGAARSTGHQRLQFPILPTGQ